MKSILRIFKSNIKEVKGMKRFIVVFSLIAVMLMALLPVTPILAATSEGVTVTATPAYTA